MKHVAAAGCAARMLFVFSVVLAPAAGQYQVVLLGESATSDGDVDVANGIGGGQAVGNNWARAYPFPSIIHALLWDIQSASVVDLNPSFCGESEAYGVNEGFQVGQCGQAPILWNGTAASAVQLPGGSVALGYSQGQIVGVLNGSYPRALLWPDALSNPIDLTPAGYLGAQAMSVNAGQQAGFAYSDATHVHAIRWNGSATSYVDLHPAGYDGSTAYGNYGPQQVGYVYGASLGGYTHAVYWNGDAASVVDLHPAGWLWSYANATNGIRQVGEAYNSTTYHAMVWTGSAQMVLDLHSFLPAGATSSRAAGIDADGNIAGSAVISGHTWAVLWRATGVYPPVTGATKSPAPNGFGWNRAAVSVSLASLPGTPGTTVANTTHQIDGNSPVVVPGATAAFVVDTEGRHSVKYFGTDSAGNVERTRALAANIDLTGPGTTESHVCTTVTLAATDALSGVASTRYSVDGGATTSYTAPFTLENAAHTVRFWSLDRAGNRETPKTVSVPAPPIPLPTITSLSPASIARGADSFVLTINGTAFQANSTVMWGSRQMTTTHVSGTQLKIKIPSALVDSPGNIPVTVNTPATCGGGTSNVAVFRIN